MARQRLGRWLVRPGEPLGVVDRPGEPLGVVPRVVALVPLRNGARLSEASTATAFVDAELNRRMQRAFVRASYSVISLWRLAVKKNRASVSIERRMERGTVFVCRGCAITVILVASLVLFGAWTLGLTSIRFVFIVSCLALRVCPSQVVPGISPAATSLFPTHRARSGADEFPFHMVPGLVLTSFLSTWCQVWC